MLDASEAISARIHEAAFLGLLRQMEAEDTKTNMDTFIPRKVERIVKPRSMSFTIGLHKAHVLRGFLFNCL